MTEDTMKRTEVANKVLDVRKWLEHIVAVNDFDELKSAAIAGEFESQMGQTIEEFVNELVDGADSILEKIPKIQSLKQCDFETRKVLEKIVMVLSGAVDHAKWLTSQSGNAVRHRFAMQAILSVVQELRDKYSYALFDAAAGIRVRRASQIQTQDDSLLASDGEGSTSWMRQAEVAAALGKRPYEISRLVAANELKSNGKKGRESRVDRVSFLEYCMKNGYEFPAT